MPPVLSDTPEISVDSEATSAPQETAVDWASFDFEGRLQAYKELCARWQVDPNSRTGR